MSQLIHLKLKQHGALAICVQNEHKSEWTIAAGIILRLGDREQCVSVGIGTRVVGEETLQKLPFGAPLSGKLGPKFTATVLRFY